MSDTTQTPSPAMRLAFGDLDAELELTRRVLERVPDEHLAWRPHERSWPLVTLAQHVANLAHWVVMTIEDDGLDLATAPRQPEAGSRDEILRTFDRNAAEARRALASARESQMNDPWTLRMGDHVIVQQPRGALLRTMALSHLIHHRGQLSVYLRLLDVPVPPMYGPSADER